VEKKTYEENSSSGRNSERKLGMLQRRSVLEQNRMGRIEHAYKIIKLLHHGCEKWTSQQVPIKPTLETEFCEITVKSLKCTRN
jgi:hypothetical protein